MNQSLSLLRREQLRISKFLRECSKNLCLEQGKQAHTAVVKMGFWSDMIISNDLVDMYCKCRSVDNAYKVFDKMLQRNVVSWTALICGILHQGDNAEGALSLLYEMTFSDVRPNEYTFSACFKACSRLGIPEKGMQVHGFCAKAGYQWFPVVGNSVVDMYAKCARISDAVQAFDEMGVKSLIAWNTIIAGYSSQGDGKSSVKLFQKMQKEGMFPDEFTFTSVLKACGVIGVIFGGTQIHAALITRGFPIFAQTALVGALIDLYVRCGCLVEARKLFDLIENRSVVSWASLVLGYAQEGYFLEAIDVFRQLRESNIQIDSYTLSGLIGVFADFAFVEQGKQLHAYIIKVPSGLEPEVGNSIADLYHKCGLMEEAERFYCEMPVKNRVSYTVMITGYGKYGLGKEAVILFNKMLSENVRPDRVTYLAILSACSHSGLVKECEEYFSMLCNDRWIKAEVEHYSCMVDLLGRAGQLSEARNLIKSMPMKPNIGVWQTLLSACKVFGDLELGKEIGKVILELDGDNPVNYILMSNLYANAGYWKECQQLRETVRKKGLRKEAGQSWVEIDKKVHFFYGGDDTHPLTDKIHDLLKELERRLKQELGYSQEIRFALHDVEEESKVENLRLHSEKLAIGLALLCGGKEENTKVIRVFKNLRVCGDCHEFIKGLSKVLEKVFIVRDANRFHKFQDGVCSCGDYW
ncbi:putative pentatricopeptide repeat-containing protein At3g15130 [Chenopodium quinoa]|uniref:putative pentatricopeptide repeat-containing protein At3g15130 n=1 Tax=Chenopodium quinoa TaxID=63459 RepID=UPI000B78C5A6|nr:putative pentatricopeptide repeat-containing protein At3g15130 [Chenopodium quinoa]